jgi:hypothetical protein
VHAPYRDNLEGGSAHLLRNTRIGGNGVPIFRAWWRTPIVERLNAAAARMIDTPCSTKALRRSLSASVQVDLGFERTVRTLFRRLETAVNPASVT